MAKVFVSSTCFDLIDLRAEVYAHLRDLGLTPLMSDRPTTEFDVNGYGDSIATCLVNVDSADVFVCILSQRYGPKLGGAGYDDVSATHLEYRRARAGNKRILFYMRDRLVGDCDVRKRCIDRRAEVPPTLWVPKGSEGIFDFVEEHRQLVAGSQQSNWYKTYTDSADLKEILSTDLRSYSRPTLLRRLIESGNIPTIIPDIIGATSNSVQFYFRTIFHCVGSTDAISPTVSWKIDENWTYEQSLGSVIRLGSTIETSIRLPIEFSGKVDLMRINFSTPQGYNIQDTYRVNTWRGAELNPVRIARDLIDDAGV